MLYVHSLLSLLVLETGTDKGIFEALKTAVAVKQHRRQQGEVREIQNDLGASDMHDASIFEFISSVY